METGVIGGGILVNSVFLRRALGTGDAMLGSDEAFTEPVEAVRAGGLARRAPLGSPGISRPWMPAGLADRVRSANGGAR